MSPENRPPLDDLAALADQAADLARSGQAAALYAAARQLLGLSQSRGDLGAEAAGWEHLGRAATLVGVYQPALTWLQRAAQCAPHDHSRLAHIAEAEAAAWVQVARRLQGDGDAAGATRALAQAAHQSGLALALGQLAGPDAARCASHLIRAQISLGGAPATAQLLDEHAALATLAADPQQLAEQALLRGMAAQRSGDLPVARAQLEAALAAAPPHSAALAAEAAALLAEVCADLGDSAAAYRHQRRAAQIEAQISARGAEQLQLMGALTPPDSASAAPSHDAHAIALTTLSSLRHELATPTSAILNFTKFLSLPRYGTLSEPQRELQQRIIANANHLHRLIEGAIDLARLERGQIALAPEPCDLRAIIESAAQAASGLLPNLIAPIHIQLPEQLPPLWADPPRLQQASIGLIVALAQICRYGHIEVSATTIGQQAHVQLHASGIAPDARWPAPQGHAWDGGALRPNITGAELHILVAQRLIALQGGALWDASGPGEQIAVCFSVPLTSAAHSAAPAAIPAPPERSDVGQIEAPPPEDLRALLDLTNLGDMAGLRARLSQLPPGSARFAAEIQRLAAAYEDRLIADLLQRLLDRARSADQQ
jgi:signal transduction histidine kinase